MLQRNGDFQVNEQPSHKLKMANDVISSYGDDTVIGDSATLYVQIDSTHDTSEFEALDEGLVKSLSATLESISVRRQGELDAQVGSLDITDRLSNREILSLSFSDVPFLLSIGNDVFDLHENEVIAVGDFATIGIVFCDDEDPSDLPCPGNCLRPYVESIENLRKKPSVNSFLPRLILYETDFFYQRFDVDTAKTVEPKYHGDTFNARSSSNVVFGDYLNSVSLGFVNGNGDIQQVYVYGDNSYENYEWMADPLVSLAASAFYEGQRLDWAADTIVAINGNPSWDSQKSTSDIVIGSVKELDTSDTFVEHLLTRLFFEQVAANEMTLDMYRFSLPYNITRDPSLGPICSARGDAFIPSHTLSSFLPTLNDLPAIGPVNPIAIGLSPSPTVTAEPTPPLVLATAWYPRFTDSSCGNDLSSPIDPYMAANPKEYLFASAEACCISYFHWDLQQCRKKSIGYPKFYPTFDPFEAGCINDGKELEYLQRNGQFLFDTLEECCGYYYPMNSESCMKPGAVEDPCQDEFKAAVSRYSCEAYPIRALLL